DAQLILKLYELRREELLRKARRWIVSDFNPKTAEEFLAVINDPGSEKNAYYRQVLSYWEMAASLVLHGAVKPDLFFDSNGEGLYILAKFSPFREEIQARTGRPFMRQTSQLVEKYTVARDLFHRMRKQFEGPQA
ncbi:MAG TPA: hypothetical protein VN670_08195, partial [Acidobacteriaceae bacterium]|nr:hypothetical protein [Acidobacteriaceae bacterium]